MWISLKKFRVFVQENRQKLRLTIAILLLAMFVLNLTARDHIIHSRLYDWGLQFDWSWCTDDWNIYFWQWQTAIFACSMIAWVSNFAFVAFFSVAQTFWLTTTQDIVFFLWEGSFPVGNWDWMIYHNQVFGGWNTPMQLAFSVIGLTTISLIVILFFKIKKFSLREYYSNVK